MEVLALCLIGLISVNAQAITKEELGRSLFFDPVLSGGNTMSCATCHNPFMGFQDGRALAIGENGSLGQRRTPTLFNIKNNARFFWDGRALSLESQAMGPITAAAEMNQDPHKLVEELKAIPAYKESFAEVYGSPDSVTFDNIVIAIAAFERTITHPRSRYEDWLNGNDSAFTPIEKRGFQVFAGKGKCFQCHNTENLHDFDFHDIGVPGNDAALGKFQFKTPTLWGISKRPPYFHNGSAATLEEVVQHYQMGGQVKRATLSEKIKPLRLTPDEMRALVKFLKTL